MQERTYGVYSLEVQGFATKEVRELGWVHDVKWIFSRSAVPDRKFELDHAHVLFGAAKTDGLKLEVRPRLDGDHLPGIMVPTTLQGNLTTVADGGRTQFVTRVALDALETAGLTCANFLDCSFALECTVGDMPTLEEAIQAELKGDGMGEALPPVDADPMLRVQEAADRLAGSHPGSTVTLLADGQVVATSTSPAHETPEQFLASAHFGQLSTLLQAIGFDPTDWDDPKSSDEQDAAEWRALLLKDWDKVVASGALEGMYEPEEPDMPFPPSSTDSGQQPGA